MLRIRLQRIGRRNYAAFRIVVTEHTRAPKSGDFIERLGSYDPNKDQVILKDERIKYWLSVGAKPTDVVYNILVKGGVIEGKLKNVLPKKTPIKKESNEQEAENKQTDDSSNENAGTDNKQENAENQEQQNQDAQENESEDSKEESTEKSE